MADSDEEIPFSFRVSERLKQAFKQVCSRRDRSMSQELRDFMRWYVAEHADERQYELEGVKEEF